MKKQAKETELGVRLVKPHSAKCDAEHNGNLSGAYSQWNTVGWLVVADAAGRKGRGTQLRPTWMHFMCAYSKECPAECLIRIDAINDFATDMIRILADNKRATT